MAKQQKKKSRPSWFQKQIEKNGGDFLLRKQPLDIQREALNIVRDIARGNITKKDFEYLFTTKVLSNIKLAIYDKYIENHCYNSAISFSMQVPNGIQILETNYGVTGETIQKIYNSTKNLMTAYCVVLQGIDAMLAAIQYSYPDHNARDYSYMQVYSSAQYQISRFKFII